MRVNINLATRPYQDVRQFLLRWGSLVALIAVLTGGLLYYAYSSWRQSRDVNRQIAVLKTEMDRLDRERAAGLALLNRPENKDTTDRARFLNAVIARKAFSWTRVFEDLEKMMPPRLHVTSLAPELDKENQLGLRMMVAGDSRDRAVELVRRMEESPSFRNAQLKAETTLVPVPGTGTTDTIQFEITSQYIPSREPAADQTDRSGTKTKATQPGDEKQKPDSKAQRKEQRG